MARKLALIIGNSTYEDSCLAKLAAPDVDVRALADVLRARGIGDFDEVTPLLNEGLATVRKAIARFFDLKHRDDLLFLYFSGHGVRDEQGHLYLAVRDTERAVLAGTAIEASFVTARMDRSASKRLVLVLDCCHSGAFGFGSKAAQGATVGTASAFEGTGRGRVVLTATDSTQYAWEGDSVIGDVENSLFTHYLIEGLRSGAADIDQDGQITIDELYDYIYEHVLNETPKQTPGKWTFGQQGDIVIAQNPVVSVAKLPIEIEEALKSRLPSVRFQVLSELQGVIRGRHEGRAKAARAALDRLAEDDSRRVAAGALVLKEALENDETLSEEEWLRRVQECERDITGRKNAAAQLDSYLDTAAACIETGDEAGAREMIARALAIDPKSPEALRLRQRLEAPATTVADGKIPDAPEPAPAIQPERSFVPSGMSVVRWIRASTLTSTAMRILASLVLVAGATMVVFYQASSRPVNAPAPMDDLRGPGEPTAAATPPGPAPQIEAEKSGTTEAKPAGSDEVKTPRGGASSSGIGNRGAPLNRGNRRSDPPAPEPARTAETRTPGTTSAANPSPPPPVTPPAGSTKNDTTTTAPKPEAPRPEAGRPETPKSDVPRTEPKPEVKTGSDTSAIRAERPAAPVPDEESLREAVASYARAFTSGDRDAVRSVFPGISDKHLRDVDALRDNFGRDRYGMNIAVKSLKIEGLRARVSATVFHTGIDNSGKAQQMRRDEDLTFAWNGTTWVRVR